MKQSRLVIISGLSIGAASVLLMRLGNPANMGVCVACFIRDIAGGLGLHRAAAVQYLRPEVPGPLTHDSVVHTREFKPAVIAAAPLRVGVLHDDQPWYSWAARSTWAAPGSRRP